MLRPGRGVGLGECASSARSPRAAGARSRPSRRSCAGHRWCRSRRPGGRRRAARVAPRAARALNAPISGARRRLATCSIRPLAVARFGSVALSADRRHRSRTASASRKHRQHRVPRRAAPSGDRRARPDRRAGSRRWPRSRPRGARALRRQRLGAGDDVGRADPRPQRAAEPAAALERGADVERRRHGVRPERRRRGCRPRRRAAPAPVSSARSGRSPSPSVEIRASSRFARTQSPICRPRRRRSPRCRPARRSRSGRAARPQRRAAPAWRQQVAPGGAVLVDPPPARTSRRAEEVDVARDVGRARRSPGRRRRQRRGARQASRGSASPALVISPSGR